MRCVHVIGNNKIQQSFNTLVSLQQLCMINPGLDSSWKTTVSSVKYHIFELTSIDVTIALIFWRYLLWWHLSFQNLPLPCFAFLFLLCLNLNVTMLISLSCKTGRSLRKPRYFSTIRNVIWSQFEIKRLSSTSALCPAETFQQASLHNSLERFRTMLLFIISPEPLPPSVNKHWLSVPLWIVNTDCTGVFYKSDEVAAAVTQQSAALIGCFLSRQLPCKDPRSTCFMEVKSCP